METERGPNPGPSDRTQATPSTRAPGVPSTGQVGAVGQVIDTGLERAGGFVRDAVDKTREKVAEYRERGMEQVTHEVAEYTRSRPVPALLIAAGVGMVFGMLLRMGRR